MANDPFELLEKYPRETLAIETALSCAFAYEKFSASGGIASLSPSSQIGVASDGINCLLGLEALAVTAFAHKSLGAGGADKTAAAASYAITATSPTFQAALIGLAFALRDAERAVSWASKVSLLHDTATKVSELRSSDPPAPPNLGGDSNSGARLTRPGVPRGTGPDFGLQLQLD